MACELTDPRLAMQPVRMRLVTGRDPYETVIGAVRQAQTSIWIATANLKEMRVEVAGRRRYRSVLDVLDDRVATGVEVRLLHAALPSRPFRDAFDGYPRLVAGGMELRLCPRVHMKAVVVDGRLLYLGSANWTGAGLGAKSVERRNFELGILTDDEGLLDAVQAEIDRIWRGAACGTCRLRDTCEAPLDLDFGPPADR